MELLLTQKDANELIDLLTVDFNKTYLKKEFKPYETGIAHGLFNTLIMYAEGKELSYISGFITGIYKIKKDYQIQNETKLVLFNNGVIEGMTEMLYILASQSSKHKVVTRLISSFII